ncbi:MAG: hypothetical protein LBV44_05680 [Methylobacillus sp.]|jgi:hypothetical protein|nr:hypothetical protein [Methylobacillus sp.]
MDDNTEGLQLYKTLTRIRSASAGVGFLLAVVGFVTVAVYKPSWQFFVQVYFKFPLIFIGVTAVLMLCFSILAKGLGVVDGKTVSVEETLHMEMAAIQDPSTRVFAALSLILESLTIIGAVYLGFSVFTTFIFEVALTSR